MVNFLLPTFYVKRFNGTFLCKGEDAGYFATGGCMVLSLTSAHANPSGYCFGGPFSIEIAATDNVAAGLCPR